MTGFIIAVAVVLLAVAASIVVLVAARAGARDDLRPRPLVTSAVERDDQFVEQLRRGGKPPDLLGRMLAAWRQDVQR